MVFFIVQWNLALDQEKMQVYLEQSPRHVASLLRRPELREFRAFRNALGGSPQVVAMMQFDSLADWAAFVDSSEWRTVGEEKRRLGIVQTVQVWQPSPYYPNPLVPGSQSFEG